MLRLFRKIRQKLLIDGKFGKYLLYAIGEVLILIFGIVIALQVNNWNLERQNKLVEISILKSIKANFESDLINMQGDIDLHQEGLVSSQIILDHIENNLTYNDSLDYHFLASNYVTYFVYSSGAIQTLKSLGVNIITNEELRNEIVDLYDVKYNFLIYLSKNGNDKFTYGSNYIFNSRFDQVGYFDDPKTEKPYDGKMIPINFEQLRNDSEYIYYLKTRKNGHLFYSDQYSAVKSLTSQLILSIEEELIELEK